MQGKAKAEFIGRLTRDPEVKTVGGVTLVSIGLAVNRKYKDKEESNFFDLEAWRECGDHIAKNAKKGDIVNCEAKLKMDTFEDKNGNPRTKVKFEVVPYTFQFLPGGPRKDESDGNQTGGAGSAPKNEEPF